MVAVQQLENRLFLSRIELDALVGNEVDEALDQLVLAGRTPVVGGGQMAEERWQVDALRVAATVPDMATRYRFLTGPDDSSFCDKVTEALADGYELHGSPTLTYDSDTARVICGQAVIRTEVAES